MATPPYTIRNISSTPLEIKLVERYVLPTVVEKEKSPFVSLLNTTQKLTGLKLNDTTSTSLPDTAQQPSASQEVSVRIEPFQTCVTSINGPNQSVQERVRFSFEIEGDERHQVDTPSPTNASTVSKPLSTANPRFSFTAIYLPQYVHLTFFSSASLASWMSRFKDATPLSALSIPGTHNSPTHHHALPSVQCQAVGVPDQLNNGVRFLDIRVQPEDPPDDPSKDGLVLVHGNFPISLRGKRYFRDLVNDVLGFLDRNPSETVIMSVKREGPGAHTDAQLSRRLRDHYAGDVDRWFTEPRIPSLGEARRKIVLMRRFALDDGLKNEWDGRGWGINAETWQYNTPSDVCPSGDVCVQDFCEVMETKNIEVKIQYCEAQFNRSAANVTMIPGITTTTIQAVQLQQEQQQPPPPKQPFHVNFLSASNFWNFQTWPERIAAKINPAVIDFLCRRHGEAQGKEGYWSTGIVVCDWVGKNGDWDLIRCIVGMNAKLESKMRNAA